MDLHEEAFENVRKWWRAWVDKDLGTVKGMLDPDYAELTAMRLLRSMEPMEIGEVMKEAGHYARDVSIRDWELFDPVTRLFERTVVCSYGFRIAGERAGHRFAYVGHATDVLVKKDDRWTYVSHRGTLETSH